MSDKYKTGLYFLIGVFHGYINRHDENLYPDLLSESKEDYEQCILFYLKDKNVLKVDYLAFKTKYNTVGGLGKNRFEKNKIAQEYLVNKYPDLCKKHFRKDGTPEIKFKIKNKN